MVFTMSPYVIHLYVNLFCYVAYLSCLVEDSRHDPRIQRRILHLQAQYTPPTQLPFPVLAFFSRKREHTPPTHLLGVLTRMRMPEDMGIKV